MSGTGKLAACRCGNEDVGFGMQCEHCGRFRLPIQWGR